MKTKILSFVLAACFYTAGLEAQPSVVIGTDASSAYIFHGMTYNKGFVMQPYLNITGKYFGYLLWSNYNLQSDDNGLGHLRRSTISFPFLYRRSLPNWTSRWGFIIIR